MSIANTSASDNGNNGVAFSPSGTGTVKANLNQSTTLNNAQIGIALINNGAGVTATVVNSIAANNTTGISAGGSASPSLGHLILGNTVVTGNTSKGVFVGTGGSGDSFGDNKISGNATDLAGNALNAISPN